jgi:hypothetical protein
MMNSLIAKIKERPTPKASKGVGVNSAQYFIKKIPVVLFLQTRNRDGARTEALLQKV